MRLKLPNHFQARLIERGIEIDHVKKAIREPDSEKGVYEGRTLVVKRIDEKREIEVVYFKDGFRDTNDIIIVTARYI